MWRKRRCGIFLWIVIAQSQHVFGALCIRDMLSPLPAVRGNWQAPAVLSVSVRSDGDAETTVASFFTQLYNRGKRHPTPPQAQCQYIRCREKLCNARDEVVVLDDLFPHADSDLRKQQEKTFLEVLRYVGDGTVPARSRGSEVFQQEVRCGVLFTGNTGLAQVQMPRDFCP